jgi:hypothetical protein
VAFEVRDYRSARGKLANIAPSEVPDMPPQRAAKGQMYGTGAAAYAAQTDFIRAQAHDQAQSAKRTMFRFDGEFAQSEQLPHRT